MLSFPPILRGMLAWPIFWLGHVLYRAGSWLLIKSEDVQGPDTFGPWDELP